MSEARSAPVAVIAGLGEAPPSPGGSGRTGEEMTLAACEEACRDAGVATTEVDAIVKFSHDTSLSVQTLAANLRCGELRFGVEVPYGGGSASALLELAAALVTSGAATTVLCHRTIVGDDWVARMNQPDEVRPYYLDTVNYLRPAGWTGYMHTFACMYSEHVARHGTTRETLGHVLRQMRANAARNRHAANAEPINIDEYLATPPVIGPFSHLDDFAVGDVGCAVVVTVAGRARAARAGRPVAEIAATAQSHRDGPMAWFDTRVLSTAVDGPARHVADLLFHRAGIGPGDVHSAHLYDCTTFAFLHLLEEARFCERGAGAELVAEPASLAARGVRPANTNGGDLAGGYSHGFRHILEAARQVTGTADHQVPDAETALVMGAPIGATSGAVLRRREL